MEFNPVCGSDNKTYPNIKLMTFMKKRLNHSGFCDGDGDNL